MLVTGNELKHHSSRSIIESDFQSCLLIRLATRRILRAAYVIENSLSWRRDLMKSEPGT